MCKIHVHTHKQSCTYTDYVIKVYKRICTQDWIQIEQTTLILAFLNSSVFDFLLTYTEKTNMLTECMTIIQIYIQFLSHKQIIYPLVICWEVPWLKPREGEKENNPSIKTTTNNNTLCLECWKNYSAPWLFKKQPV